MFVFRFKDSQKHNHCVTAKTTSPKSCQSQTIFLKIL